MTISVSDIVDWAMRIGAIGAGLVGAGATAIKLRNRANERRELEAEKLTERFDTKADKHTVNNHVHRIDLELGVQRKTQAKIFDQIRQSEQRAEDRHRELMMILVKKT